jgi:hypothetical protein
MIKLKEAQKVGTTIKDTAGRTVSQSSFMFRDLFINPEHIISINEEYSSEPDVKLARIETIKGAFLVVGTPNDIEKQLYRPEKKVLRD